MAAAADSAAHLPERVAPDFPILEREVHGKRLVYLDSAASSQKPRQVVDAMGTYYRRHHSNVHRGAHTLGEEATAAYEDARTKVGGLVHAGTHREIVFTKNATEALNLVAQAWGGRHLRSGDRIVLTAMEHHANIVPWMMVAERTGATIDWIPLTEDDSLDMEAAGRLIPGARVVACTAASNVLGALPPIHEICRMAGDTGALSVIDASQLAPHFPVDVQTIGCDFLAFTGHKILGPTGIGVLWGRLDRLDETPPFLGGGEMISTVTFDGFEPAPVPAKFEAGTMPIAEAVGLSAAVDYVQAVGYEELRSHEVALLRYSIDALDSTFGDKIKIHGPRSISQRTGIVSFTLGDVHPHDLSTILDQDGIAIRAGHHCAKPLMQTLGVHATARASFYLYNTVRDADALVVGLERAADLFGL